MTDRQRWRYNVTADRFLSSDINTSTIDGRQVPSSKFGLEVSRHTDRQRHTHRYLQLQLSQQEGQLTEWQAISSSSRSENDMIISHQVFSFLLTFTDCCRFVEGSLSLDYISPQNNATWSDTAAILCAVPFKWPLTETTTWNLGIQC